MDETLTLDQADAKAKAVEDFKAVIATKPSHQTIKHFLNDRAMMFLRQTPTQALTRKQRRLAARMLSKRLTKQAIAGEAIL